MCPELKLLILGDTSKPSMDKSYYYIRITSNSIQKSSDILQDESIFGTELNN